MRRRMGRGSEGLGCVWWVSGSDNDVTQVAKGTNKKDDTWPTIFATKEDGRLPWAGRDTVGCDALLRRCEVVVVFGCANARMPTLASL